MYWDGWGRGAWSYWSQTHYTHLWSSFLLKILVVLAFRHKAAQAEKFFNSQNHKIAVHNESHGWAPREEYDRPLASRWNVCNLKYWLFFLGVKLMVRRYDHATNRNGRKTKEGSLTTLHYINSTRPFTISFWTGWRKRGGSCIICTNSVTIRRMWRIPTKKVIF